MEYLCPTFPRDVKSTEAHEKFEGATVLEPKTGAYFTPITVLDFASLYPSCMVAENICYSSVLMDERFNNLPGVQYSTFNIDETITITFAQNVETVLPRLLNELKLLRKQYKREMARCNEAGETFEASVWDARQLAVKISMNSAYGFTGAVKSPLPYTAIAACVTSIGRSMIYATKHLVEKEFAGAEVVYGDTDSVFIKFAAGDDFREHWSLGERAAKLAGQLFKPPHVLELEKILCPFILARKKRYLGVQYEDVTLEGKTVFKGFQVSRRDSCKFVRTTLKHAADKVLVDKDVPGAVQYIQGAVADLLGGRVPVEHLIMSKKLAATYKDDNHPHLNVVKKMKERAPGSEPRSGDRVPFLYVAPTRNVDKSCQQAEDPRFVIDNHLPVWYEYYLTNGLVNPVLSLFDLLMPNARKTIFETKEVVTARNAAHNLAKRQRGIQQFCVPVPRYVSNNDFLDDSDTSM